MKHVINILTDAILETQAKGQGFDLVTLTLEECIAVKNELSKLYGDAADRSNQVNLSEIPVAGYRVLMGDTIHLMSSISTKLRKVLEDSDYTIEPLIVRPNRNRIPKS